MKAAIQRMIKGDQETKYVANEVRDIQIYGNLDYAGPGGDVTDKRLYIMLPQLGVGAGPNGRIGNHVAPVKVKVSVQYYFVQSPLSGGQSPGVAGLPHLVEVRQVAVAPKAIKRYSDWFTSGTSGAQGFKQHLPRLLEKGNGTSIPADSANPLNLTYPINNERFTAIKGNKHFLLGKNQGLIAQEGQSPNTTMRMQNTLHFSVKTPKVLKYADENGEVYPQNCCPLFGAYAGLVNNNTALTYDALQAPYVPISFGPTNPILYMNYRVEMWYKDA